MENNMKPLTKIIVYALVINILYLVFFFLITYNPSGGWGNADAFIKSIIVFPILIFVISFTFVTFKHKIIFNYLSFIVFGTLVIQELNLLSFNPIRIVWLLLLVITPMVLALISSLSLLLYKKLSRK